MKFIIKGRETYNILEEFIEPFIDGKTHPSTEYIIIRNNKVIFWRDNIWPIEERFLDISELRDTIKFTELTNWRSENRKSIMLNHLRKVLSLMITHNRNLNIDEVLSKETYYDILCYAC